MILRICFPATVKHLTHRSIATNSSSAVCRVASTVSSPRSPLQYSYLTQQTVASRLWPTARYYSSEAISDGAESQAPQKDVRKSGDIGKATTNAGVAEEQGVEAVPSHIEIKDKEIVDLKVRRRKVIRPG